LSSNAATIDGLILPATAAAAASSLGFASCKPSRFRVVKESIFFALIARKLCSPIVFVGSCLLLRVASSSCVVMVMVLVLC